jgi:hypothetical protein
MKKVSIIDQILTPKDYGQIIEKAYQYRDTKRTEGYLDDLFTRLGKENPFFWANLFDAYGEHGNKSNLDYDNVTWVEQMRGSRERFASDTEQDAFIYELINKRIEEILEQHELKNRKFTLRHLPLLENKLQELWKLKGGRARFYQEQISILNGWLLKLAFEGGFSQHDIESLESGNRKTVAKILVRYYFSIEVLTKENDREEEVLFTVTEEPGKAIDYIKQPPSSKKNSAFEIFRKGYSYYTKYNSVGKAGFKRFQQFEVSRFKLVLKCFSEMDDEYAEVFKYLSKVGRMTEKEMGEQLKLEYSFGISRIQHAVILKELLSRLAEKITFLYVETKDKKCLEGVIENAVSVLTTDNYKKEKKQIKFACETTTVAYILNAISGRISIGISLNAYTIEKSGLFLVPTLKKPSDKLDRSKEFVFKPLQRANMAKSIGRFSLYRKDKERIEYRHYEQLHPVFEWFDFVLK